MADDTQSSFSKAVEEMRLNNKERSKLTKTAVKDQADKVIGDNKAIDIMKTGFGVLQAKGDNDSKRMDILKDFRDVQIQAVVADNAAIDAAWTGWKIMKAKSSQEMDADEQTHSMLGDINDSVAESNNILKTNNDDSIDAFYAEHDATRQLLGDINETMTDSYALEQEAYLRELRSKKKPDEKKGLTWLQKLLVGFGIGAVIGGLLAEVLLPFKLMFKSLGVSISPIGWIFDKVYTSIKAFYRWWIVDSSYLAMVIDKVTSSIGRWIRGLTSAGNAIRESAFVRFFTNNSLTRGMMDGWSKFVGYLVDLKRAAGRLNILPSIARWFEGFGDTGKKFISILRKVGKGLKIMFTDIVDIFGKLRQAWVDGGRGVNGLIEMAQKVRMIVDDKLVKWGRLLTRVVEGSRHFSGFAQHLKTFFNLFRPLRLILSPLVSGIIAGFKMGFKWLGWPLTFLFGIIDFIKGFAASESDTLIGKIGDGLKTAILGFIEMPIKLIGWMLDKMLGMFGVKVEGGIGSWVTEKVDWILTNIGGIFAPLWVGLKMLGGVIVDMLIPFSRGVGWFAKYMIFPINIILGVVDFLMGFFGSDESTFIGKVKDGVTSAVYGLIEWPAKFLGVVVDKILGWFGVEIAGGTANKVKEGIDMVINAIFDFIAAIPTMIKKYTGMAINAIVVFFSDIPGSIMKIGKWYLGVLTDIIHTVFNVWTYLPRKVIEILSGGKDGISDSFRDFITYLVNIPTIIKDFLIGYKDPIMEAFGDMMSFITDMPGMIKDYLIDGIKGLGGKAAGGFDWIKGKIGLGSDKPEVVKEVIHQMIPTMALGGYTKSEGLAYLHPAEIVGPAKQVIPQIINEVNNLPVGELSDGVFSSKARSDREAQDISKRMEQVLSNTNDSIINNMKENRLFQQAEDKSGDDAQSIMMGSRQVITPPADIEALGILFFNKTWGIA